MKEGDEQKNERDREKKKGREEEESSHLFIEVRKEDLEVGGVASSDGASHYFHH